MKYVYVISLHNLKTEKLYNKGKLAIEGLRISNSSKRLEDMIGSDNGFFKKAVGELEFNSLFENPYMYTTGKIPEGYYVEDHISKVEFLDEHMRLTQSYCNYLWMEKDNGVSMDTGFIYIKSDDNTPVTVTSNVRSPMFSNANCNNEHVKFTDEELTNVREFVEILFNNQHIDKNSEETLEILNDKKQTTRIERFLYLLQACRNQYDLSSRIAMYCTLFETLLSTSKSELTHKLAERTARLLGEDVEERLDIYNTISDAYKVRSSFVHGDRIDKNKLKKIDVLKNISTQLDEYLRNLILYIFSNEELRNLYSEDNTQDIESRFKELILS
ncbi:HEPN domain-containing protein [Halobacillus hunanensis]|uniref:HEPN domain-containing protein n=1 Tax=Halobacillus hunanensis TaxID=578214 RepID=UPI0009A5F6D0|nr:HEPN domain-containing protein [Halobacillus hunanensis]